MKITALQTIALRLPMRVGAVTPMQGGRPRTSAEMLLVRVDTDAGVTGWGEAFGYRIWPATQKAVETLVAPLVQGRDPTQITALMDELARLLHGVGRSGPAVYALSGLDIALWDIAGKLAGRPLHQLLGGALRDRLPAYASLLRYGRAHAVAQYTAEALSRGYRWIKLHEITEPEVRAAREAAGPDVPIMVDTNCPWTVDEAVAMARTLAPHDLYWLEEPVWPPEDIAGLAEVRARTGLRIAAGENYANAWEFRRALDARALDVAQPSVIKVGGVSEMRRVMALAGAAGIRVVPHAPYFGPGFLATLHLQAAMAAVTPVERYYCDLEESPLGDAIHPDQEGNLAVPSGPGLGIDPDPRVIERTRIS